MDEAPKIIEYTNVSGELQVLDPNYYREIQDVNAYFKP